MFVHIVMWKLKDEAGGRTKAENAALIKERFEEMANMLDGLQRLDVGIDVLQTPSSADLVLYTEFDSRADHDVYQEHPAHKALASFISDVRLTRQIIDYEM